MFRKRSKTTENTAATASTAVRPVWTFSSSGWLFLYHFGVIKCLKDLDLHRQVYTIGSSGGSCAGAFLHMDTDIDEVVRFVLSCALEARSSFSGLFQLKRYLKNAIRKFGTAELPNKLEGNYEISVSQLPWLRNRRITKWRDMEDVEQSILASSCAVPLAGLPVNVPGLGYCIDGMFSDSQLIKVSPWKPFSRRHC
uniref:Patatin n=1 Tax=Tetraselmis sp. GSL018 TaxID=582737 RepID=A0A061RQ66_9CHLO